MSVLLSKDKTDSPRINVTLRRVRVTTIAMEKQYFERVCSLVTQHALCMRRIILSSVACLTVTYFSIYLINGKIFGGKKSYST